MKMRTTSAVVGATAIIAACAPRPESIQGTYTPTAVYENLTCEQLLTESKTVSNRAHDAAGLERRHRVEDTVAVTAGVVIFWPALFFTHGADATAAEVAQLRGEMEAIERASDAKNCGLVFQRARGRKRQIADEPQAEPSGFCPCRSAAKGAMPLPGELVPNGIARSAALSRTSRNAMATMQRNLDGHIRHSSLTTTVTADGTPATRKRRTVRRAGT